VGLFRTVVIFCQSGAHVRYNADILLTHRTVCSKRYCVSWLECSKLRICPTNSWDCLDRRKYSSNRWDCSVYWEIFCQAGGNIGNITDILPKSGAVGLIRILLTTFRPAGTFEAPLIFICNNQLQKFKFSYLLTQVY